MKIESRPHPRIFFFLFEKQYLIKYLQKYSPFKKQYLIKYLQKYSPFKKQFYIQKLFFKIT